MMKLCRLPSTPKNQSSKHAELASRCLRWFAARSTRRGIVGATEIQIANGYVADAVAIGGFQHRFLKTYLSQSGLSEKWFNGSTVVGDINNELPCVFEVKVSPEDFVSTFGDSAKHANRKDPVCSMHWCVTPKGLVRPSELPDFWGLLEASCQGLKEVKMPTVFVVSDATIHKFGYDILKYGRRRVANWLHIPVCPECLSESEKRDEKRESDDG